MALIPEDPKKRNALLAGLFILAGFYFFDAYWWSAAREEVGGLEERLEVLEAQNNRAQLLAARGGADLEQRLAAYERHLRELERLVPRSQEVPALLDDIATEAIRNDVELGIIRPDGEEPGAFYNRQTYSYEVFGEFHDVGRFLSGIASLPRIITPVDLDLQLYGGPVIPSLRGRTVVHARFRIVTYVIPDQARSQSGTGEMPAPNPGGDR
jgi:type IV pilus assembly protein PilO